MRDLLRRMVPSMLLAPIGGVVLGSTAAFAGCTTGASVVCDRSSPNPYASTIGTGADDNDIQVNVQNGATVQTRNASAISLGDNADITVETGGTVTNNPASGSGPFGAGPNTIQFGSNSTLLVQQGGQVTETGSIQTAEAVNPVGYGNTITNYGTILGTSSAAIWFQDVYVQAGTFNTIDNYGTIQTRVNGGNFSVIGSSAQNSANGAGAVNFINRTGATVVGNIDFAGGDDQMTLYTGSTITGTINGGGGNNSMILDGDGIDQLNGTISNFSSLEKTGEGTWTLLGNLANTTANPNASLAVDVNQGTLILSGDNPAFNGTMTVDSAGILQLGNGGISGDINSDITNNGIVVFDRSNGLVFDNTISGAGSVEQSGTGTTTLTGANSYSGGSVINSGTLASGSDGALGVASGGLTFNGGTFRFDRSFNLADTRAITIEAPGGTIDTQDFDSTVTQAISGAGALVKTGSGSLTLNGGNSYRGGTTIAQGQLVVGDETHTAAALSGGGPVGVETGATLAGYGSITGDVTNNGTIAIANALPAFNDGPGGGFTIDGSLMNNSLVQVGGANAAPGNILTVTGDYVGRGGAIVLNTQLGSDNSPTDKLMVNGNVTGQTALTIVNANGRGALTTANGIEVVEVGGTSASNAFHLTSAVAVGAFDYGLYYSGRTPNAANQNWYLRSTLRLTPSSQTALPYADVLSNYALATLGTLQQRTGNRIWPNGIPAGANWCRDAAQNEGCQPDVARSGGPALGEPVLYGQGAWGRVGGQYASYDPKSGSSYSQSLGFIQAGYEGVAYEAAGGELTMGGYATVGTSTARIDVTRDPVTGAARAKGKITTTGYGVGFNATWLGNDGLYADTIGQFTWYDSSLSSKTGGDNGGWSTVLSEEVGKRIDFGSGWAIVPQVQLAWSHVDFDSFTDLNGTRISLGSGDSLQGRAGLRLENLSSWTSGHGGMNRLQLYGIANLTYEFLGGTKVNVAGVSLQQRSQRLWGEIGLGGTYAWNDKWSGYAEADYSHALSGAGKDNYTVKGTAGLRYRW